MHPDVRHAVRLQELDSQILELERKISALPKQLAEIEKRLASHQRQLEIDRAALTANQRDRKKIEGDNQAHQQKISKLREQMTGAKTNDQYRAFMNEIAFCEKEIRLGEDKIIDLMAKSEPLSVAVASAEKALGAEKTEVDKAKLEAEKSVAHEKAEMAILAETRAAVSKSMTVTLYNDYERIRKSRKGIAVAEALDGRCNVCNMTLRLKLLQDLRKTEQLIYCENCRRILYWNPPQAIADLAGEATSVT